MSIENTLERIAVALETIAKNGGSLQSQEVPKSAVDTVVSPVAAAPAPSNTSAPAPSKPLPSAAVPASPAATAPVAVQPASVPVPTMTLEELNSALVAEYVRLGNDRVPIDAAFKQFNVSSAAGLTPDQYAPMLAVVRAITK